MARPKVVLISMYLGHDSVPHAGGRYMLELQHLVEAEADAVVMTVGNRLNHDISASPGAPTNLMLLGHEPGRNPLHKLLNRLALAHDTRWRHHDPGAPSWPFILGLLRSPTARRAVREADVIDLQWSESIRLAGLLRRLNPQAVITGTFHDVMSQSFSREPQDTPRERRYWQGVAARSRKHEARMVRQLDRVLVFGAKDAVLLGSPEHARVVRPPISDGTELRHEPGSDAVVLVVSYLARDENDKAAHWTIEHVWPLVRERYPTARLRFVGGGVKPELAARVASLPADAGVELAGFVDDLGSEYASATVSLVPVLQGAGVKFKTVESLTHGVPVVTTTVGAEGIDGDDLYAGLADDPRSIAEAVVAVLDDPVGAQHRADRVQRWAQIAYGRTSFEETIRTMWVRSDPDRA